VFTKNVAAWAAFAIFALESLINFRQAHLQYVQRHQSPTSGDESAVQRLQRARATVILRTMKASHSMLLVLLFVNMDVGPWLWDLVGDVQITFLPSFTNEFWRSCLFLASCLFIYVAWSGPNIIIRSMTLREGVRESFAAHRGSTWRLHELTGDNVVPTVLLFVTLSVLFCQVLQINFNQHYVKIFAAAQLEFVLIYPVVNQPKKENLLLMKPGNLKDEIHNIAAGAKLKLKNIYIGSGPLPTDIEDGVQNFGWPRQNNLLIHESLIKRCTEEDIKALAAQQLGCWFYANNIRSFIVSQVRALARVISINADACFQIVITHTFSMVMIFISQKSSYSQWNFPAGVYPKIPAIVIFSICLAPVTWLWFTLQMHYMHRKNTFLAGKVPSYRCIREPC
jgi:STE24 endopeptidase